MHQLTVPLVVFHVIFIVISDVRSAINSGDGVQNDMLTSSRRKVPDVEDFKEWGPTRQSAGTAEEEENLKVQGTLADLTRWGLPDATAYLGRYFRYKLSRGQQFNYNGKSGSKVHEVGRDSLPSWVHLAVEAGSTSNDDSFYVEEYVLEGIPTYSDVDQHYDIVAASSISDAMMPKHIFSIQVLEDVVTVEDGVIPVREGGRAEGGDDPVASLPRCAAGSPVTKATVIIDAQFDSLSSTDRVEMLRRFCRYLGLDIYGVRILPVDPDQQSPFESLRLESALVAGPGDAINPTKDGLLLSWEVGCGNVHKHHMTILETLEVSAQNGTLSQSIGGGVIGWYVTNNRPRLKKRLAGGTKRRRVYSTSTLIPSIHAPTRTQRIPTTTVIHPLKGPSFDGVELVRDPERDSRRRPSPSPPYRTAEVFSTAEPSKLVQEGIPWTGIELVFTKISGKDMRPKSEKDGGPSSALPPRATKRPKTSSVTVTVRLPSTTTIAVVPTRVSPGLDAESRQEVYYVTTSADERSLQTTSLSGIEPSTAGWKATTAYRVAPTQPLTVRHLVTKSRLSLASEKLATRSVTSLYSEKETTPTREAFLTQKPTGMFRSTNTSSPLTTPITNTTPHLTRTVKDLVESPDKVSSVAAIVQSGSVSEELTRTTTLAYKIVEPITPKVIDDLITSRERPHGGAGAVTTGPVTWQSEIDDTANYKETVPNTATIINVTSMSNLDLPTIMTSNRDSARTTPAGFIVTLVKTTSLSRRDHTTQRSGTTDRQHTTGRDNDDDDEDDDYYSGYGSGDFSFAAPDIKTLPPIRHGEIATSDLPESISDKNEEAEFKFTSFVTKGIGSQWTTIGSGSSLDDLPKTTRVFPYPTVIAIKSTKGMEEWDEEENEEEDDGEISLDIVSKSSLVTSLPTNHTPPSFHTAAGYYVSPTPETLQPIREDKTAKPSARMTTKRLPVRTTRNPHAKQDKKKATTSVPSATGKKKNSPPVVHRKLDHINVVVGTVLRYKFANDMFIDQEDGGTENLQLQFLSVESAPSSSGTNNYGAKTRGIGGTWYSDEERLDGDDEEEELRAVLEGLTIEPNSWVKLNQTSKTLYGLPLDEHVGRHGFIIAAVDSSDRLAKNPFEIRVQRRPVDLTANHEFNIRVDADYRRITHDVDMRVAIASKVTSAFGEIDNTDNMGDIRIFNGSVVFAWTNRTLVRHHKCPSSELAALIPYMIQPNLTITDSFVRILKPYKILSAGFSPHGACRQQFAPLLAETSPQKSPSQKTPPPRSNSGAEIVYPSDRSDAVQGVGTGGVRSAPKDTTSDDDANLLLYVMIPLVAIAAFLFLVLVICVVCHLCRRRVKRAGDGQGVPVIFADELQSGGTDADSLHRIRPILADEARGPTASPPPDYAIARQQTGGSAYSTLRSNYKTSIKSGTRRGTSERGSSSSPDDDWGDKSGVGPPTPTSTTAFHIHGGGVGRAAGPNAVRAPPGSVAAYCGNADVYAPPPYRGGASVVTSPTFYDRR